MERGLRVKRARTSNRLPTINNGPSNADRCLWGELALHSFAGVSGAKRELAQDPETVLADLLADLMHWCEMQGDLHRRDHPVDFESALRRARCHHAEERLTRNCV